MSLRRSTNREIKRQCCVCGHTYASYYFVKHMIDMHMMKGGDLEWGSVPAVPFFGD